MSDYIYADTLAIATGGYWSDRRVRLVSELAVTVVDKTAITAVVKTRAT